MQTREGVRREMLDEGKRLGWEEGTGSTEEKCCPVWFLHPQRRRETNSPCLSWGSLIWRDELGALCLPIA